MQENGGLHRVGFGKLEPTPRTQVQINELDKKMKKHTDFQEFQSTLLIIS